MARKYYVRAVWDEEAKVFYSKTNIPGLNVETATLHEFVEVVEDLAPQMLAMNATHSDGAHAVSAPPSLELAFAG